MNIFVFSLFSFSSLFRACCTSLSIILSALGVFATFFILLFVFLCRFYAEIRKQNGKEYELDCLRVMQSALDRHLQNANYPCSIITDRLFKSSQEVLEGKCRALRAAGLGKKPNRCRPISAAEELECWEKGTLGEYPPKVYCLDL